MSDYVTENSESTGHIQGNMPGTFQGVFQQGLLSRYPCMQLGDTPGQ